MDDNVIIIKPHQVMTCPKCVTTSEFMEHVYVRDLPVILSCPKCQYKYGLSDETMLYFGRNLPKRDPKLSIIHAWVIEQSTVEGQDDSDDTHGLLRKEVGKLPPELRTRSVHERIDEVGHLSLVMKRIEHSIRLDFRDAVQALIDEVNSSIGPYAYLRGAVDAESMAEFFEAPFMVMPFVFHDDRLKRFARIIAAPRFYQRIHGIPIGNGGGFSMQLICPYSDLADPSPDFLRKMLDIPDRPQLEMLNRKLIGDHLPYCWKDIPGIEEDVDHSKDHPLSCIESSFTLTDG